MGLWSELTAWQLVFIALGLTHITIIAVTVFLHRSQTHRAVDLGFIPFHFFRFWLWLTTGMVTREWVAIHRKHHAKCETEDDPHSPHFKGLHIVLWRGAWLYRQESLNQETLKLYGRGTPDDWLEHHLYARFPWLGISLMFLIDLGLFGFAGLAVWLVQMLWIPFWAAGVINGLGHWWGYRNWQTEDASTNISPFGLIIGGEELHNNHHAFAASARLSSKWYEFDAGWMYIRLLEIFRMAKVRNVAPRLAINPSKQIVDVDTVAAVLGNRMQVLSNFARQVTKPVLNKELCQAQPDCRQTRRLAERLLSQSKLVDPKAHANLEQLLADNPNLATVYQAQQRLLQLWERAAHSQEARLEAVQEWINQAEKTGVVALAQFAQSLRGYSIAA
ncbi:MAG TPA: fatty acid desaturase [Thiolinea sp.]|nr:fatty acid desaturase [Thiolinea sp.]